MAKKRKLRKLSSAQFTRAIPKLSIREIDKYIREHKGGLTAKQVSAIQGRATSARHAKAEKIQAQAAREKYKPRKQDRGKIVFIGTKGERQTRNRGYAVYVTKRGKKWLLKGTTERPFKSIPKKDLQIKAGRNLRNKLAAFEKARLVESKRGRSILRGKGAIRSTTYGQDFSGSVIKRIASNLKKVIEGQASQRSFLIEANLLLRHEDGTTSATSFAVPIGKADHISIRLAGLQNFVRQRFYLALARALQYMGFITSGSAAHIQRVTGEQVDENVWEQYHSDAGHNVPSWSAPRFEVVKLEQIEWKINQAK